MKREAMQPNDLEMALLERMLSDSRLDPSMRSVRWNLINVKERSLTGVGFLTEFGPSAELKVFKDDVSLRWGEVGARLNVSRIETAYVVYVDGGQITAVEGYTYGDEWPATVDTMDWYELKEGAELENPPMVEPA